MARTARIFLIGPGEHDNPLCNETRSKLSASGLIGRHDIRKVKVHRRKAH